jgi:hypothetical protein
MTEAIIMIASVSPIPVKVINSLTLYRQIPDPLPWRVLAGPLAAADVGFS